MGHASVLTPAHNSDEADLQSDPPKTRINPCDVCDIAREADHRIANHLAMLARYVGMKQRDIAGRLDAETSAPVQLAFESIEAQVKAVASLHRSLAMQRRGTAIDLREQLQQICAPFKSGLSGPIQLTQDVPDGCLVRSEHVLPVTQIVSEVITNAIKHSHVRGEGGTVAVSCHAVADNQLEIEIRDDGAGLPQRFDALTAGGLGFRLIRALTAQIGAQSGFDSSGAGTRFWLRLEAAG